MKQRLRWQLGLFSALFAAGMWMSKVAQPLHFEHAHALVAFGIGYAVMAIVGGFSFAWGAIADRIGGLNAMRIGALLYAAGLTGRVFTEIGPAVIFSAVAGAGASMTLVGIRPWIRAIASDTEIPKIVGGRNLGNQIGVFAGTLGAAGIFALASHGDTGTRAALLVAPAFVLAGALWLLRADPGPCQNRGRERTTRIDRGAFRAVAVKLSVVGVLSGFYVSLVSPYVPLFLTHGGLTESAGAVVIALMSVVQVFVSWVLARRGTSPRPFRLFAITEAAAGGLTIAVATASNLPPVFIAALFIARAGFVALAVTAEETIQFAVIPGSAAGFAFGISQTAFLIGDAVGGAVGAPLWAWMGPGGLAAIAGVATIANAILLPALLRSRKGELAVAIGTR